MKQHLVIQQWSSCPRPFAFFFLMILCALSGCERETSSSATVGAFDPAAAKEWYYGIFKKTLEWGSYDRARGGQLPDWDHGLALKTAGADIVEYPLITSKTCVTIPDAASLSSIDREKIAEATQLRIDFIRSRNGTIAVRLISFIPDAGYLRSSGFDLSGVHLGSNINGFSGRLFVRKWNGMPVSAWRLRNGKFIGKISQVPSNGRVAECGYQVTEYSRDCAETWSGENLVSKECDPWEATGNSWFEPGPCDDSGAGDPCSADMTPESCECQLYGTCGNDPPCDAPTSDELLNVSTPMDETDGTSIEPATVNPVSAQLSRNVNHSWFFCKNSFWWYHWKYKSYEKAVEVKEGGIWKFLSVTHSNVLREGEIPPCFDVKFNLGSATEHIANDRMEVRMELDYSVSIQFICCKGMNPTEKTMASSTFWHPGE